MQKKEQDMKVNGLMGFAVVTVAIGAAVALFVALRPGESRADFWASLKPGDRYPGCASQTAIVIDGRAYGGPLVEVDCIYLGLAPDGSHMIEVPAPYNPKDFVPEELRSRLSAGDPDIGEFVMGQQAAGLIAGYPSGQR